MRWWLFLVLVVAVAGAVGYWWWENVAFCHYSEMRETAIRNGEVEPSMDTCRYSLIVPADLDLPGTRSCDTTIVRDHECRQQLLHFPPWGTRSDYRITGNGIVDTIGFAFDQDSLQWLNITEFPNGRYNVHLVACGNGGSFTLDIQ